jgi:hypothetical protein
MRTVKRIDQVEIGNELCDMHYGQPEEIIEGFVVDSVISWDMDPENCKAMVDAMVAEIRAAGKELYYYTNKMLVVFAKPYVDDEEDQVVKLFWAYDGFTFGVMTLKRA